MIRFTFRKGLRFNERQRTWTLIRRLANQKLQLEDEAGEIVTYTEPELLSRWLKRELVIDESCLSDPDSVFRIATPRDLATYPESIRTESLRRLKYVVALDGCPVTSVRQRLQPQINKIAAMIGDPKPPSPMTLYRWLKSYRTSPSGAQLVSMRHRSGRPKSNAADDLLEESISTLYLNQQQHSVSDVYNDVRSRVEKANKASDRSSHIRCPSRATVYRRLEGLEKEIVDRARLGKNAAERKYRPVLGTVKVGKILERIEVDHTPLDLLIIDEETNLPLGRPWLTVAIDKYSRAILGFYVAFHEPSSFTILQCIKRAILPKDGWLSNYPDIQAKWPCHGIPELIATDNGMDLHSAAFSDICFELGIQLLFCPAKKPEYKGSVERFFRTISEGLIHRLPGTVFSNVKQRGDYPSEELAAIDLKTLMHLLTKWVVEIYHCSKHRKLGMTPLDKWYESAPDCCIELPAYPEQLDVLVGIPTERTLFRYGLEVDNLMYNSEELQTIFLRLGSDARSKIKLKYYEDDVSYIHAFHPPTETYIRVPAVDWDYAQGLNRHVHTLIQAAVREQHGSRVNISRLLEVKDEIQKTVSDAIKNKKMRERKRGATLKKRDSEAVIKEAQSPIEQARTKPKSVKLKQTLQLDSGLDDDLPSFKVSTRSARSLGVKDAQ
ncbi:transposase family protein [Duganella sp. FT3S]|uniref:Transposase family protein n=1 Tax=Rugamonas fusca TaxID=2758568 RepID=A0A7W2EK75_9BURK|nr:DDE-type integrase/transposase/recombinase [Rugamonas fusca]MBA5607379.1 transposase family protein [Rugamonas fusca]